MWTVSPFAKRRAAAEERVGEYLLPVRKYAVAQDVAARRLVYYLSVELVCSVDGRVVLR